MASKKAQIGDIRKWAKGEYQKVAEGKWKKVAEKRQAAHEQTLGGSSGGAGGSSKAGSAFHAAKSAMKPEKPKASVEEKIAAAEDASHQAKVADKRAKQLSKSGDPAVREAAAKAAKDAREAAIRALKEAKAAQAAEKKTAPKKEPPKKESPKKPEKSFADAFEEAANEPEPPKKAKEKQKPEQKKPEQKKKKPEQKPEQKEKPKAEEKEQATKEQKPKAKIDPDAARQSEHFDTLYDAVPNPSDPHSMVGLGAGDLDSSGYPTGDTKAVLDSVALFTAGNVASVRDPSKFDPELAEGKIIAGAKYKRRGSGSYDVHSIESATREQYEKAHQVMKGISALPYKHSERFDGDTGEVFRGMNLPPAAAAQLSVGSDFDLSGVSSWSANREVASGFSYFPTKGEGMSQDEAATGKAVLFRLVPTRGRYINSLSTFPGESEFVTGGRVRVVKRTESDDQTIIDVEHM